MALIDKPFLNLSDMLSVVPDLIRLQSYRSVYGYVFKVLPGRLLALLFLLPAPPHPVAIHSAPPVSTSSSTTWNGSGASIYAIGGTGAIIAAFKRLLQELGAKIHLNSEVDRILIEQRRTQGVRLKDGSIWKADAVVSNADAAWTYLNLIPERPAAPQQRPAHQKQELLNVPVRHSTSARNVSTEMSAWPTITS